MRPPLHIRLNGQPIARGTFPLVITPLVGRTDSEVMDELANILPKRPDLLEWRVDFFDAIGDPEQVIATARSIRRAAAGIPLLLTRRSVAEGGQPIPLDEPAVVAMLGRVCAARCVELIDYELACAAEHMTELRAASAANGIALILSHHNFERTPDRQTLLDTFARGERMGADVVKLAVMPADPQDVLTLLGATYQASQTLRVPLISMSMGGLGAISRIMGWQYGSAATFAVGKSSSAPGQLAIEELRAMLAGVRRAAGH